VPGDALALAGALWNGSSDAIKSIWHLQKTSVICNIIVAYATRALYSIFMNTKELMRLLKKAGVSFDPSRGKGGHIFAALGDKTTVIPQHGSNKELGTGLVRKILKDLGIERE